MKIPVLQNNECLRMKVDSKINIWILSHEFRMGASPIKRHVFTQIRTNGGEIIEVQDNYEIYIELNGLWYPARICDVNINTERRLQGIPDSEIEFTKRVMPFMAQATNGVLKFLGKKSQSKKQYGKPDKISAAKANNLLSNVGIISLDSDRKEWRFI